MMDVAFQSRGLLVLLVIQLVVVHIAHYTHGTLCPETGRSPALHGKVLVFLSGVDTQTLVIPHQPHVEEEDDTEQAPVVSSDHHQRLGIYAAAAAEVVPST